MKPFPAFRSVEYGGMYPSIAYLTRRISLDVENLQTYYDAEVHRRAGSFLAIDHSFKYTKHLATLNGERLAHGVFTGLNEYSEIVQQVITQTAAITELKHYFKDDAKNREILGLPSVLFVATDNCCKDSSTLLAAYPTLTQNLQEARPLPLPDNVLILSVKDAKECAAVSLHIEDILDFVTELPETESLVLGFDTEWDIDERHRNKVGKVCVIQLATRKPKGLLDFLFKGILIYLKIK
jgi:hypothetical protein